MNTFLHYESLKALKADKKYAKDIMCGISNMVKKRNIEKNKVRVFRVTGCFNGNDSKLIKNALVEEGAEVYIGLWENFDGTLSCRNKESELIGLYKSKTLDCSVYSETASRLLSNMNEADGCNRYLIYGWELKRIEEGNNIGKGIKSRNMENALNETDYNKDNGDLVLICAGLRAESSLLNIHNNMRIIRDGEWYL